MKVITLQEEHRLSMVRLMSEKPKDRGRVVVVVAVVVGLATSGCIYKISEEHSTAGVKMRDCVVPLPAGVSALGAPISLEYPDASLFIWESVETTDGTAIANVSALVTSSADLCKSGPALTTGEDGEPRSLLALSAAEAADNAARTDGRQLVLSPHGGFVYDDVGYLYYEHALVGLGPFDAAVLGTGLCVVTAPDQPCTRLDVGGDTKLWPPSDWPKNHGGLVYEGRAILLGCRHIANFEDPCVISSVPLDQIPDPTAYRYFSAFSGWGETPESASVVLNLAGATTMTPVDGRYAATNLDIFDSTFRVRFAPAPTGDFSMPIDLFDGVPPVGAFAQGGQEHHALREDDRGLAFTYFVDRPGSEHGLHAINFELHVGLQ
jgi:hypothetical protein